jgi:hypothetical protein
MRRPRLGVGLSILALCATVLGFAWLSVQSYDWLHGNVAPLGQPHLKAVAITGDEEVVFDWSRQACEPRDIPDLPARAYRDASGQVHLIASHYVSRANVGSSLDNVNHACSVVMRSKLSRYPQEFADREWIASPYTINGRDVFALVHNEYHGNQHAAGNCLSGSYPKCWYNAVTLARSDDEGKTFRPAGEPPANLVAELPYPYKPGGGPYGVFAPSNIVKKGTYYYSLVYVERYGDQEDGTCPMRTRDLADARSWRAWDGDGYNVTFENPYEPSGSPQDHICEPVSRDQIGRMTQSLTFNTYFGKYLLIGSNSAYDATKRRVVSGFFYSLSDDLIHWSRQKLIHEAELPFTYRCGDSDPVVYPSVLDPQSTSRNFETTGRRPYLYFTREHFQACTETLNRDLVRVPIEFSK